MSAVALILGSGANIGSSVAKLFLSQGWKVASVSRSGKAGAAESSNSNHSVFRADLSSPDSVADVFQQVKVALGPPEVVVYNAAQASQVDKHDPMALSVDDLTKALTVNAISAFAAAQQAVKTFKALPSTASRTFLYTGNALNSMRIGGLESLGAGKTAAAHLIQAAAEAYGDQGLKFYYCDERKSDGSPAFMDIDGDAHAKLYLGLAKTPGQGPWLQTFVKEQGYKHF